MTTDCIPVDPTVTLRLTWQGGSGPVTLDIPPSSADWASTERWWWSSLAWPFFDYVYTYLPQSEWMPGQVLKSAVPGATSIPITLGVNTLPGDGQPGLVTARATLEAAFTEPGLTVQFLIDGTVYGTWDADPAAINWGPVAITTLGTYSIEGTLAVPVNPVEAT